MTDARVATADDEGLNGEAPGSALVLPAGLRADWPAPRLGVYGRRSGALASIEAGFASGLIGAVSRLPGGAQDRLVGVLAWLARAVDRRHSNAARGFLRQALGETDPARLDAHVLRSWRHLFRVTLDSAAFPRVVPVERVREHFDVRLGPDVVRLLAEKRGSIVVGAHVGDWEAGSAVMPWLGFDPFYAISRPPKNRPLSVRFQALREARGIRCLPRRGAMQHAPAVLRAGGCVAMLLDQRARSRPVMASFFGRSARCDRGAGVLLKRVSAPVVFAACYRTGGRFRWRLEAERVLWPEEAQHLGVDAIVELVNRELERMILKAPEQYFWLHDRYRGADEPDVRA